MAWPLAARTRRPGDRFRPAGGRGSKKLKAWLIDRKVARERRDGLVLLADGRGRVLAIPELGALAEGAAGLSIRVEVGGLTRVLRRGARAAITNRAGGHLARGSLQALKQSYKTALLWVFLIVMFVALWQVFDQKSTPVKPLNWSQFMAKVESGEVKDVTVKELDYSGHLRDGTDFTTTGPLDAAAVVVDKLLAKDVTVRYEKPEQALVLGAGGLPVAAAGLPLPALLLLHAAAPGGRRQGHELRQVAAPS